MKIDHLTLTAPAYVRAELTVRSSLEPHEAPVSQLAGLVAKIVAIEGPVHIDEVSRRISAAFGKARTGQRIAEATARAVRHALEMEKDLRQSGSFLLTAQQESKPPVRDRSGETGNLIKAAYLPPMEIAAAAAMIRAESGEMAQDELVIATARLLGFQRVGTELGQALEAALQSGAA